MSGDAEARPMFNNTGLPPADEAHVQGDLNLQRYLADEYRKLGQVAKADEIIAGIPAREAKVRNDLGVPAPAAPDPAVVEAREHGVELKASPDLYQGARIELPHVESGERKAGVRTELTELAASMQLNQADGKYLITSLAEEAPRVSRMSPEDRGAWIDQQERYATEMARRRGSTLEEWKTEAKKQLSGTPLGRQIAESFSMSSATLLAILADAREARKTYEASRK